MKPSSSSWDEGGLRYVTLKIQPLCTQPMHKRYTARASGTSAGMDVQALRTTEHVRKEVVQSKRYYHSQQRYLRLVLFSRSRTR